MRRNRLWLGIVGGLAVLLAADTLAWYLATQRLRGGLADWVAAEHEAGWDIEYAKPTATGWPYAAGLRLGDVSLRGTAAPAPGMLHWQADHVTLRITILHPFRLELFAAGTQRLQVAQAAPLTWTADLFRLDVPLTAAAPPWQLTWHATQWRSIAAAADAVTISQLTATTLWNPAATKAQPALGLTLQADGIALPTRFVWALGPHIASLRLDTMLSGPLSDSANATAAATAWRNAGGSLELREQAMQWGPLGLHATATFGLDARLQPTGEAKATATGYAETLDAFAHAGVMPATAANTAKAILSLLANVPANGGPPAVEVPLTLRDGVLSARQIPLLRVPQLDWPAP